MKPPKGELTVVISEREINNDTDKRLNTADKNKIKKMIQTFSIKDIVTLISKQKKISKKDIYNYCLKIRNEK